VRAQFLLSASRASNRRLGAPDSDFIYQDYDRAIAKIGQTVSESVRAAAHAEGEVADEDIVLAEAMSDDQGQDYQVHSSAPEDLDPSIAPCIRCGGTRYARYGRTASGRPRIQCMSCRKVINGSLTEQPASSIGNQPY